MLISSININVKCEFLSKLFELKKADAHDRLSGHASLTCVHFTVVVPQIPCCLDKEKPSDVSRGEVMGVQTPR